MNPPPNLLSAFDNAFNKLPELVARAPGRVNLLGEHVDYNDGWVLPVAIDYAAWVAASPCSSDLINVHAIDLGDAVSIQIDDLEKKVDVRGQPLPAWSYYPAGVAWALQQHGLQIGGLDTVLTSTIPLGAGLSSSAAIEVVFAITWQAFSGWQLNPMIMAQICQTAENAYVGVNCGLMDQFASLHGIAGSTLLFDCRTLEWEPVPLPQGTSLVIADSGVRRSLGDSAYNERRASCEQATRILAERLPNVRALRDVSIEAFDQHSQALPPVVRRRAEHVVGECARTLDAVERLRSGDALGFGKLMFQGHASLRDLYQVSCPELDVLVEIATGLSGCYGARLTGAGFGGCTINLVKEGKTESFSRALSMEYRNRTGKQASVWICQAVDGARFTLMAEY
jgi:galactokinase